MKAVLTPDSTIRAHNSTDAPITVGQYTIQPGGNQYVSFLWMRNHYGDPRSKQDTPSVVKLPGTDQTVAVQARQSELARVNTVWGIPEKFWQDIPPLEFYDDNGDRIVTVYDDPTGMSTTAHTDSESTFLAQQERIEKLETMLEMVLKATGTPKENLPFDLDEPEANAGDLDIPSDESITSHTTSPWESSAPIDALLMDDAVNE